MEPLTIQVPVPDSPVFWIGLAAFSVIVGIRLILGLVSKFL